VTDTTAKHLPISRVMSPLAFISPRIWGSFHLWLTIKQDFGNNSRYLWLFTLDSTRCYNVCVENIVKLNNLQKWLPWGRRMMGICSEVEVTVNNDLHTEVFYHCVFPNRTNATKWKENMSRRYIAKTCDFIVFVFPPNNYNVILTRPSYITI
jgi:hypothetical protein